jgi:hypothetical protein
MFKSASSYMADALSGREKHANFFDTLTGMSGMSRGTAHRTDIPSVDPSLGGGGQQTTMPTAISKIVQAGVPAGGMMGGESAEDSDSSLPLLLGGAGVAGGAGYGTYRMGRFLRDRATRKAEEMAAQHFGGLGIADVQRALAKRRGLGIGIPLAGAGLLGAYLMNRNRGDSGSRRGGQVVNIV